MKINRLWAMSNSHTFSIPPIRELIEHYVGWSDVIIDPFANDSTIGTITNDLNPKFDTDYHMDTIITRSTVLRHRDHSYQQANNKGNFPHNRITNYSWLT